MTLDEAIKHAEEVALENENKCEVCANEHRQLAEWLKDYKRLLKEINKADVIERSEYEYLKKENRELAIKYDNAMNMVINEQENVTRLRSKIDKAIEESYKKGLTDAWECARKIGNNSQLGLEEMGFDFSELDTYYNPSWWVVFNYDVFKVLEIFKRML